MGTGVPIWTTAEVPELSSALNAYIAGTISTVSIRCSGKSDVQLTIDSEVKADIVLFPKNAIVVAKNISVDL
ncbi:hypothetical protein FRC04_001107 [Tulasnella sp. 424]|nr:hypothetical protein FRC04_001107 [Tulasnella sp. 424]